MTNRTDANPRSAQRLDRSRLYEDLRRRQRRRARVAAMLAAMRQECNGRAQPALLVAGRPLPVRERA